MLFSGGIPSWERQLAGNGVDDGLRVAAMAATCTETRGGFLLACLDVSRVPAGPQEGTGFPRGCGVPRMVLIMNLQFPLLYMTPEIMPHDGI